MSRGRDLIDSLTRLLRSFFWVLVAAIVLLFVINGLRVHDRGRDGASRGPVLRDAPPPIPWGEVHEEMALALEASRKTAEEAARPEIEAWIEGMKTRVDADFLEWYFSYWTQQMLQLQSFWFWSQNQLFSGEGTRSERITETIQEEFASRVLQPETAQLTLERITRDALTAYVDDLQKRLGGIQRKYHVPQGDWERYLDDLAAISSRVEGGRKVSLTLKTVVVGGGGAAVLVGGRILPFMKGTIGRIGTATSGKLAARSAATVATKTGAKVGAKAGGKMLGPIIGVGVVIWDIWDHHSTKTVNRPILREGLFDYLDEMGKDILDDPRTGVMGAVYEMEASLRESLRDLD